MLMWYGRYMLLDILHADQTRDREVNTGFTMPYAKAWDLRVSE